MVIVTPIKGKNILEPPPPILAAMADMNWMAPIIRTIRSIATIPWSRTPFGRTPNTAITPVKESNVIATAPKILCTFAPPARRAAAAVKISILQLTQPFFRVLLYHCQTHLRGDC